MRPFFSVIVPTHGRPASLTRCLNALRRQNYPSDCYEIIIVHDGGAFQQTAEPHNPKTQILTQPHRGPAAARNFGAAQAKGRYLAFTDDDCIPAVDWLTQVSAAFNQYPDRLIGGQVINELAQDPYAAASQLLVDYLYEQNNADPQQAQFFTSNNLALRRDLFLEIGGFDAHYPLAAGEDREFCRRWLAQGNRLHYQPSARIYHAHHLTLARFWRQHRNYGRGAYHFHQQETLEPLRFYVNLLRYPFQRARGLTAVRLFLLFLIMQAATAVGYLRERLNPR